MKKLTYIFITLYLFLLSWDGYLLVSGIVPFSPSFIPLGVLLVVFLLTSLKKSNVFYNKILLFMGLMLIYMLFSILWSANNGAFKGFLTLAGYFLTAFIIYNLYRSYNLDPKTLISFYLGVLSVGLYTYFTGDFKDIGSGRFSLAEGFNPTWFSAQIVWALILSIFLYIDSNKLIKTFFLVGGVVLSYLLLLTGGRNALLSLVVALLISLVVVYRQDIKKILTYTIVISLIGFSAYYITINTFGDEILNRIIDIKLLFTDQSDIATAGRTSIWSNYLDVIPNYILFGAGFYSSHTLMSSTAHNIIITILFELGILGLILYFVIMFLIIKPSFNIDSKYKFSFMTMSLTLFFLGLGNDSYYYKYWWAGIFIYLIMLTTLKQNLPKESHEKI